SAAIARMSGAEKRYGFNSPWEKPAAMFYTHGVPVRARHVVQQNLELADAVIEREHGQKGIHSYPLYPPSDPVVHGWVEEKLRTLALKKFVILNPGAGWGAKQWPPERYAEIARALGAKGIRSLINFGPGEEDLARKVGQESDGHAVASNF